MKKLVVSGPPPNQVTRFRVDQDFLKAYVAFSDLTSKLYHADASLNELASRDFQLIRHLRESISFYWKPLLPVLKYSNIYNVICQENLSADCEKLLGVSPQMD